MADQPDDLPLSAEELGEFSSSCESVFAQVGTVEVSIRLEMLMRLTKQARRCLTAEAELGRSTDWYQQRFNRLRRLVDEEVRPLSPEVANRYYAIVANGSPAPHERADWTNTMHGLTLRAEWAESSLAAAKKRIEELEKQLRCQHTRTSNATAAAIRAALEKVQKLWQCFCDNYVCNAIPSCDCEACSEIRGLKEEIEAELAKLAGGSHG